MRKWLFIVIFIVYVLFVSMPLLLHLIFFLIFADTEIDHRSDWHEFYTSTVSHHFYIPQEAEIVFAKEYYSFPMGYGIIVKFCLPSTKSPKEWIDIIAQKSGFTSKCKINELLYEEIGVYRKIQYLPKEDLYVVEYHFD